MKGAVQGACLSPPYDAQEQGPLEELPGGKKPRQETQSLSELKQVVLTNLRTWKGEQ